MATYYLAFVSHFSISPMQPPSKFLFQKNRILKLRYQLVTGIKMIIWHRRRSRCMYLKSKYFTCFTYCVLCILNEVNFQTIFVKKLLELKLSKFYSGLAFFLLDVILIVICYLKIFKITCTCEVTLLWRCHICIYWNSSTLL